MHSFGALIHRSSGLRIPGVPARALGTALVCLLAFSGMPVTGLAAPVGNDAENETPRAAEELVYECAASRCTLEQRRHRLHKPHQVADNPRVESRREAFSFIHTPSPAELDKRNGFGAPKLE